MPLAGGQKKLWQREYMREYRKHILRRVRPDVRPSKTPVNLAVRPEQVVKPDSDELRAKMLAIVKGQKVSVGATACAGEAYQDDIRYEPVEDF